MSLSQYVKADRSHLYFESHFLPGKIYSIFDDECLNFYFLKVKISGI